MSELTLPRTGPVPSGLLADWLTDARRRTLDLVTDLNDPQLLGPQLPIVNPLLWEIGHLAWFHEKWLLRQGGALPSLRTDADRLYDSSAVPHDTRWNLPLPSRAETLRYMGQVQDQVLDRLGHREPTPEETYFLLLSIFHEDMHTEAFLYGRQTLAYPRPALSNNPSTRTEREQAVQGSWSGDVEIPGGELLLGAEQGEPFVFDNEQRAHPVALAPFAISRAPVTQAEFAAFVNEDGYSRREFWSDDGWRWRETAAARQPVYWARQMGGWLRRDFTDWRPLEPHRPMLHISWYEAEAYCNWAGRRLPTEAEWERAASGPVVGTQAGRFPWGDAPPAPERANLDGTRLGCVDVADRPAGDSVCGCRQMIGNVWEWTQDDFHPYPGFVPGPYRDYSQPWFGTHKVLRGGCWATRARLLRTTYRNFFRPERRDIWAGFRTCKRNS